MRADLLKGGSRRPAVRWLDAVGTGHHWSPPAQIPGPVFLGGRIHPVFRAKEAAKQRGVVAYVVLAPRLVP